MISDEVGLSVNAYTWPIAIGLMVLWGLTVQLCPGWRRDGWVAMPMSLFGFAWLGFGIDIVLRFLILSYNSVLFGNMTFRLADRPASIVNETLMLAALYWACVSVGFASAVRRSGPGPFVVLVPLARKHSMWVRHFVLVVAAACIVITEGAFNIPQFLLTPLSLLGSLWVIPASLLWGEYFRGTQMALRLRSLRWLVLAPGVLHSVLSPYRERWVLVLAVPFIAALFAGKRYRLLSVATAAVLFLLVTTVVVSSSREIIWGSGSVQEEVELLRMGPSIWQENPHYAPWLLALRRFHGFDSLLLTVDSVPDVFPYSGRSVFVDSFLRGVVPRVLYPEKDLSIRGMEFARTIWGYHNGRESSAFIAPSMPGDLYEAGGFPYVVLGGAFWGLLLGLWEGWKRHLPSGVAAGVTILLATQSFASIERDFSHTMATTIQILLLLTVVAGLLLFMRSHRQRARNVRG